MEDSYPNKLQVWNGPTAAVVSDLRLPPSNRAALAAPSPLDATDRLYADEALSPSSVRARVAEGVEPHSLQWFLSIENQRHNRYGRWLPRLLEFSKHSGENLLAIGNGLGTDWLQYARNGANVVVCSSQADQLALVRRNFELRGLEGRFLHAPPTALPVEAASIDVVCVSSLLQEGWEPRAVVDEVYRVLKPGGKVLALLPARRDVDFWFHVCFPWQRWLLRCSAAPVPRTARFTPRSVRRLFGPFAEHRVYQRQLRRSEVPHVWRWLPPTLLERCMGRLLVLKAFKPLSTAMTVHLAA